MPYIVSKCCINFVPKRVAFEVCVRYIYMHCSLDFIDVYLLFRIIYFLLDKQILQSYKNALRLKT